MKRLFVTGLLFVFMAVMPLFHAVADDNQCRNLFDVDTMLVEGKAIRAGSVSADKPLGSEMVNVAWDCTDYISVLPDTTYTYTIPSSVAAGAAGMVFYSDKSVDGAISGMTQSSSLTRTFTTPPNCHYVRFSWYHSNVTNVQLEKGSTATSYVPYNPLCATCNGRIENYVSATGTVAQNGTPTPTNPIEPTFYQQGNMVLRKVGDYADSYDATTGKITRRVGVKVLKGNEYWANDGGWYYTTSVQVDFITDAAFASSVKSTHFPAGSKYSAKNIVRSGAGYIEMHRSSVNANSVDDFKQWLAQQYAAGTPVTVYYPLATETTENWNETTYCAPNIKIATTAYNAARFSPVKTDLDSAVATIREIVTKTINQTAAIASLQADKQTRPEDACPAGKKCLLVETEENGVIVPHWFPIIEAPEDN